MQVLSANDERLFRSLVSLTQDQMQKALNEYLSKKYNSVIQTDSYLYAPGNLPIALVAHMDTVFSIPPTDVYYDKDKGVLWSPSGLGADDRAGIFAILKILSCTDNFRPSVIFTRDEELGALGAGELVKDFQHPVTTIKYIIQLDRRGTNDCVFYSCANQDFIAYIEKFGFLENFGSFSDISFICPTWGIAGVNLSVGYENEHSYIETLHIEPLLSTIEKVKRMLRERDIPEFEYIQAASIPLYHPNQGLKFDQHQCVGCHQVFDEMEVISVIGKNKNPILYCPACFSKYANWCSQCGRPFEKENDNDNICSQCRKEPTNVNV